MARAAVERRHFINSVSHVVHANTDKAVALDFFEQLFVGLVGVQFNRCKQQQALAFGVGHDLVNNLVTGLGANRLVAIGAVRGSQTSNQNPQVVVNFGDGSDSTPRRRPKILLFDRDRWREPFNLFDFWFFQLIDELPRVGAKAFDVASLAFGVNRIHRHRRLTTSRRPGEHGHLVAFDVHVDRTQAMLFSASDFDRGRFDWFLAFCFGRFRNRWSLGKCLFQSAAGVGLLAFGDFFWRAATNHSTTARTTFGADVDDPVRCFDHVQVVFDHQNRIASFDEVLQNLQQHRDVGEVQTSRRFVQQIQCLASAAFYQFPSQFNTLGFTAGERW